MDLELEEIFQWQTPFCALLADIDAIPEDGMLDQISLPEIHDDALGMIPSGGGVDATVAANLASSTFAPVPEEPISSPLWPCDLHTPSVNGGLLSPVAIQASFAANFDSVGSPQSSTAPLTAATPFTPPAGKPTKRIRGTGKKSGPKTKKGSSQSQAQAPAAMELPKESRLPTQAEHIIRERQRRDDMAAKYLILESLLPPAPKRERAVVVENAMVFVKDLQQKRIALLKRRAQLKLHAPGRKKPPPVHQPAMNSQTDSPISSSAMARQELLTSPATTTNPTSAATTTTTTTSDAPQEDPSSAMAMQQLQIHVHFSQEEIVIEMVCHHPQPNFQSFLLQAVESFGLDVSRCSIHRVSHGFVQCTISCTKSMQGAPSPTSTEIQTSASLVGALRNVLALS